MRCKACNVVLTDKEAVKKDERGEYIDLCNHCLKAVIEDLYPSDENNTLESIDIV